MTSQLNISQSSFAAALLDPSLPCPPGLLAWNASDPAVRLAVYRNNVVSSLVDALADTFPVVQELVGEEFFRAMAAVFARQSPPRSRILAHYGDGFAGFIEQFKPARTVPYLADMARLEFARVRAFHATDAEPVAAELVGLALASGERIGELRLVCHPSVHVIQSAYAVVSLWGAHQDGGDITTVVPSDAEAGLVLRDLLETLVLRLPLGAARFVAAIQRGLSLGEAAEAGTQADPSFDLSAILGLLIGHRALTSIHLPGRQTS